MCVLFVTNFASTMDHVLFCSPLPSRSLCGRIPLQMPHEAAALVGGLRQAIDDMLVRMATDPTLLMQPPPHDDAIIQATSSLVSSKPTPPNLPALPPGG